MPSNTKKKTLRNNMTRFLESYKADLSFGVTRGKRLPAKHFLLATGLRNITGSRTAIDVLSHLGHYVDYDKTCQIETAQAIKTQKTANDETALPFKPRDETCNAPTFFWADNFDITIECQKGVGSVTTHLIAFQEIDDNSVPVTDNITVKKSTKRQ